MNRADKRRNKKLAAKAAKTSKPMQAASALQAQQQLAINLGLQHHSAGDLAKAESIYKQILQSDPNQPVALHFLGVIAHQVGKYEIAVELIGKALAIKPDYADAHSNLGNALQEQGKLDDAVASYHTALATKPDYAEVHNNLGNVLKKQGKLDDAVASYHKALAIKPDYAEAHNNLGNALREHGKLDDAIASYHKALAIKPDYAEAHYNLGIALNEQGKLDDVVASYRKALAVKPDYADAHNNLGNVLKKQGKLDDAVASYRKALAIKPDYAEANCNLGAVLKEQGKLDDAVASYHKALAIKPDYADAHSNLGNALKEQGKLEDAVASYCKALAIKPDYAEARNNFGNALKEQGELDDAVASFRKALAINPDYADAHSNLGNALQKQGKLEDAIVSCGKALTIKPDHAEAHNNLGNAFQEQGNLDDAVASYHKALAIKLDYADAHSNLGVVLQELGNLDDAVVSHQKALAIKPDFAEGYNNLGSAFKALDKLDDAVASYQKALAIKPDFAVAHSNLIFTMLYFPTITGAAILKQALSWDQQHSYPGEVAQHNNVPDSERRLRIGYVSADFKQHAAAYLLEPLLAEHDREQVELFCYAEVQRPDHVTERFKGYADHWRSTVGVSDAKLAETIREDMIDIIVDCTGHTAKSRLLALTRKPAPLQINHFTIHGSTSGAKAMDYVLGDSILTPVDFESDLSEDVIVLPHGAFSFLPDPAWPEVAPRSSTDDGPLFACVGDPARIAPTTLTLWARLLDMVPRSCILFKHGVYGDPKTRETWRGAFKDLGDRTLFEGVDGGWAKNMDVYGRVDVVLDTLPMSGGMSCIIPLWMGVPVITMASPFYGHRTGTAMVTRSGMPEFSADNPEDYLSIASDLVNDPERLTLLRATMRDAIRASHLMDARGHAAEVEAAYRTIWRTWCEGASRQKAPSD